jgi:endonuclease/exonuclease/phosphatase family metal-dependent hydrolase
VRKIVFVVLALGALPAAAAHAQLRIVTLNGANSGSATAGPRAGMGSILSAIGSTVSDDPTLTGNTGIAKPIDVLCLQEARSAATTGAGYAQLLNQLYSTNTYKFGTLDGDSTGSGTQAIVYNSAAVTLIGSARIGTASTTGAPRQALRYELRPVGYGADADVWVYNSHYKSADDSTSRTRRTVEATAIRADSATLPAGANVIYLGDLNTYNSSETCYTTLLGAGNGQAFDPINKPGSWDKNDAFRNIHTQSPFNPNTDPANGFNGTAGGMDSRFDQQLVSNNLRDGHGVAYIPNSYQAFGNNGSHLLNQAIDSGTGAPAPVMFYLASILDHLPVVADYQLPAKMSVSVGAVPSQVIVGANVPVSVTVTNTAPAQFSNGADSLQYAVNGTGAVTGAASGVATATLAGNAHALFINTTSPGAKSGAVTAASTSEAVADGAFSQNLSTTVLAHASPSFAAASDTQSLVIDFGVRARGSIVPAASYAIFNRADASGFTAGLDVDSVAVSGSGSVLSSDVATLSNLAAAGSAAFSASLDTTGTGSFSTTYTLATSDQDLPGATTLAPLTVSLSARVAIAGDATLDDAVNLLDFNVLANNFGTASGATWTLGDFNRDAAVDLLDFNLLAANFGLSASASGPTPQDWSNLAAAVPEPASSSVLIFLGACVCSRRRRSQ